jgi:hypothetical protein
VLTSNGTASGSVRAGDVVFGEWMLLTIIPKASAAPAVVVLERRWKRWSLLVFATIQTGLPFFFSSSPVSLEGGIGTHVYHLEVVIRLTDPVPHLSGFGYLTIHSEHDVTPPDPIVTSLHPIRL